MRPGCFAGVAPVWGRIPHGSRLLRLSPLAPDRPGLTAPYRTGYGRRAAAVPYKAATTQMPSAGVH